jgi:hypothetical protein
VAKPPTQRPWVDEFDCATAERKVHQCAGGGSRSQHAAVDITLTIECKAKLGCFRSRQRTGVLDGDGLDRPLINSNKNHE